MAKRKIPETLTVTVTSLVKPPLNGLSSQNKIPVPVKRVTKDLKLSFPGPVPPIDNDTLKKYRIVARNYRNRRIGYFLKELHLTEGRSTGIPKIRKAMKQNGSPGPVFETDADRKE